MLEGSTPPLEGWAETAADLDQGGMCECYSDG